MKVEHNIFIILTGINGRIISTFINNIKIIGIKKLDYVKKVKQKFAIIQEIIDIKPISFYLGLKVEKNW